MTVRGFVATALLAFASHRVLASPLAVVDVRVAASTDDAEEYESGTVSLSSTDLELVNDGTDQTVGMRFNGIAVPRNATITNAWIQFTADEEQSETTSLLIRAQATSNASTFVDNDGNITSRTRTSASAAWNPVRWSTIGEAGPDQRTPNVMTLVQEIVNRTGWSSGNSIVMVITGSGHRTAVAYDGDPAGAPLLHIEWTTTPTADLSITKTDGAASYAAGGTVTYTITVGNGGPSSVTGATVGDTLPALVTSASWTCTPSSSASCAASGTGNINDTVNLPAGGSVVYTLTAAISPSAATNLVNTATVAVPAGATDPVSGNNSATDTDTRGTSTADLSVTKTDGVSSYTPGATVTYTITVGNAGPGSVTGAAVADTLPALVTSASWTCAPGTGASCAASGTGNINDTVNIPAGRSVVYTVTATISPAAATNLVNTASVAAPSGVVDPASGNNTATDTDTRGTVSANLSVTKTDGVSSYTPGATVTYTITVGNAGPSNVTGATVVDTLPALVTSASWTCAPGTGASCAASGTGNINDTVNIPAGRSVVYTLTVTISPSAATNLVNTATAAVPAGVTDPVSGNNSATDTDTRGSLSANLSVTKTDGVSSYTPGATVTYTITVGNAGPSNIAGATVVDTLSALVTSASWTCAPGTGASCTASGTGNINDTVTIPAGRSVVYTLTATISPSAATNLANTATVAVPAGALDPVPGNNSATDTDTRGTLSANLSVTKTDGVSSYTPGGTVTYTITVGNAGPSSVTGATVVDTLPALVTSASWTCAPGTGASCAASGTGNISDTVTIPAGRSVVYTLTATIAPSAATNLANTATVAVPSGATDPVSGNNSATDTDTRGSPSADLSVAKSDGVSSYTPGGTVTYTITVGNAGPSNVTGATVADTLPALVTSASWTCAPGTGATCAATGTGNINDTVTIPAGRSVVYTLTATISQSAATNLVNTATATVPAGTSDPESGNDSATDTDTPGSPSADLAVTKTDGVSSYTPGGTATYTITVGNSGPSDVTGATVTDTLPALVTSASWTCVPEPGATCTALGTGDIDDAVDLPVGKSVIYTLTATISPSAATDLVNTASVSAPVGVTDPAPGDNAGTDTDSRGTASADLSITKTDGALSYPPGGTVTYTITVANAGPSDVSGATVADALPALVTSASWTCAPSAGATCAASGTGDISDTVDLPAGQSVVYTVVASIASAALGNLVNTATVAAPSGVSESTPGNNSATDTDTRGTASADLSVTKTDGVTTYTPGGTVTYTIVAANAGPSDVAGATVTDTFSALVTGASWTCAPSAGATCAASGTGNINDLVTLPAGKSVTYTVVATIAASASTDLVNTATASVPSGFTDPIPGNSSATDTDARGTVFADLSVTKADGVSSYTPGGAVTYTITVGNTGPSDVTGATVTDTLPALVTSASWTCVPEAGATCTALGTGDIDDAVDLPVGKSVIYTLTATISPSAATDLINTASVSAPVGVTDPAPGNNAGTDTDSPGTASADLSITKTDGVASYAPGGTLTYTITVGNGGPSDVAGATVVDAFPAIVTGASWTCAPGAGASCGASGTGNINDTINVPSGTSVTYTATATISPAAGADLVNTATVSAPAGATDPTPGNNAATDTDTRGIASADLSITKTDGVLSYTPGGTVTYTISVANAGPSNVTGATVADALPAIVTGASWTCSPGSGATCAASGTGNINDTVTLPVGGSVTYIVVAAISPGAATSLVNTATVAAPTGVTDPTPDNNAATDTDTRGTASADLSITKTDGVTSYTPGGAVTYTITVANSGPSDVLGAAVEDVLPAVVSGASWTCTPAVGASCSASGSGDVNDTVNLPAGTSIVYTLTAAIASSASGDLTNTATVAAPAGVTDPTLADNVDSDTDARGTASADLAITKTDGVSTYTPGGTVAYTIVVANAGPSDVSGATVTDAVPSIVTGASWTCAPSTSATCTASGSGNVADTVDIPAGRSVTYTVVATIAPGATTDLVNTATVSAPAGVTDPTQGNDAATDTDTKGAASADLSITKSDGVTAYTPGETVTYTITVENGGPSDVSGASVADALPSIVTDTSWTCVPAPGASCGAGGTGSIADTVDLPAGKSVVYTLVATVASSATGNLVNTATVAVPSGVADPTPGNNGATDTDIRGASLSDLSVTKSDGVPSYTPGGSVIYTIVVANAGPSDVTGATVVDALPAIVSSVSWTCTPGAGASCTLSGSGNVNDTVNLPAGRSVTYSVTAATAPSASGDLVNTAVVSVPADADDPDPANDSATDTDTQGASAADLQITKSDGVATYLPGQTLTYTIVVTNAGPNAVTGAKVTDVLPALVDSASWTCVAGAGATCTASGTGSIADTIHLAVGSGVVYTVVVRIAGSATGDLVNTAAVAPPPGIGDPFPANSTATDRDLRGTTVVVTKAASQTTARIGDPVGYVLSATNGLAIPLVGVTLQDLIPAGFKLVADSARLTRAGLDGMLGTADDVNGPIATSGVRPLVFGPFDLSAGESIAASYALRVGSGVGQGAHDNVVTPFAGGSSAGPGATARVTVVADAVFDQSTILGKVYEDKNRNGWQDAGEAGVPQAMVVLDDGTYVLTDDHGRLHFPATNPGQRMVKLNRNSLPYGTEVVGEESRVLWITPGVPVRADFGVILPESTENPLGSFGESGVQVSGVLDPTPVAVRGDVSDATVLVNDTLVPLSTSDVKLEVKPFDEIVQIVGDALPHPVSFRLKADSASPISRWSLDILDGSEAPVKTIEGKGALPDSASWDATTTAGELVKPGRIYQYRLSLRYADGTSSQSATRFFGVNRQTFLSMELTGDAFIDGTADLAAGARATLDRVAAILREYSREKVVIAGHTDAAGDAVSNLRLSRRRAEAARDYLAREGGVEASRLALQWFGGERPRASNDTAEGRATNRRVEIKGEVQSVVPPELNARTRTEPFVWINETPIPVADSGRFEASVPTDADKNLEVELANGKGRTVRQTVDLPELKLELPQGEVIAERDAPQSRCVRSENPGTSEGARPFPAAVCRIRGRTEAGNTLHVDGKLVPIAADGTFTSELSVGAGRSTYPVIVRSPDGVSRGANVRLSLVDHDGSGKPVVVSQTVANVMMKRVKGRKLQIEGLTDPGNQVRANGLYLVVGADGRFRGSIDMPAGLSRVVLEVKDKRGDNGWVRSEHEVPGNQLFMLALADGTYGKMSGKGLVEAAGKDQTDDYYADGRVAFYLKGVIAGKYLITSSFDSARQDNGTVFKDLNGTEGSRLLTNLDPDRYYPVYGDDSTLVYDVESQGKFYLALDSDTMSAVVGDYPLAFKETELAAYQRTLYGARYAYRSLARSKYGDPDTSVILFGAQVRQAHVRDEVRATGGSLYYLSHKEIVEGSEQVTLVIRDKNTRLLKSQEPQRQNVDYTIKYPEGRVTFLRPISSVSQSGSITEQQILSGDPVFIQVDYEAAVQGFEKTAAGVRARQQIGDHVAVGGTYVQDDLQGGEYQLEGVDAELKLGTGTRLTAEAAVSSGADSLTNQSEDGGLSYTSVPVNGTEEGSALKVAAEVDVGEWFQKPDRYHVRVYFKDLEPGFFSSGNFQEQGTTKAGVNADFALTANDAVRVRYDQEERTGSGASLPGATKDTKLSSAQWEHRAKRWGTTVELFQSVLRDAQATSLGDSALAAVRGWMKFTEKVTGRMDLQKTVSGVENDQATADIQYQVLPSLALEAKGTGGSRGSSAEAGAVLTLGKTNVYLTERTATDQAGNRTATVLGARSPLGASSQVYTEYQWEETEKGKNAISLVGLQRQWDLGPGFRFVLSGENAHVKSSAATNGTGTPERDRSALAASVSYEKPDTWAVLSRNEIRFDGGVTTTTTPTQGKRRQLLTFNQFSYKLSADLSLVGKLSYSTTENTDAGTTEAKYDERSLGFAYRPVASDRFNALGRYTHLSDLRPASTGAPTATDRTMDVLSVETILRITPKVEWAAKLAARAQDETLAGLGSIETDTLLTIQRFNVGIWNRFDLGLEYRIMRQRQTDDQRQGWLSEFMWKPVKYVRVGLGYNFTDFSDNEFSANDYSQSGWFVRVQGRY